MAAIGKRNSIKQRLNIMVGGRQDPSLDLEVLAERRRSSGTNANLERRIEVGGHAGGRSQPFPANQPNHVSTTEYELYNIVPKNLWEQFQRAANIWFLIVSISQNLPGKLSHLSPTNRYATVMPLFCLLFVTFCKDAWEDYGRRRDDRRVNNQLCNVVVTEEEDFDDTDSRSSRQVNGDCMDETRQIKWKDVHVGAYLRLKRDDPIPADMILLACSNEDGVAYVDTAQLDGETSLKPKFALEETMRITSAKELTAMRGHVDTEPPNQLVQSFSGTLFLQGFPRGVPIDAKNFLLRGSTLRNTDWVFGLVVFTGYDTKLVQNLKKTPSKRSQVEVTANYLLLIIFTLLLLAAATCAFLRIYLNSGGSNLQLQTSWVYPVEDAFRDHALLAFITFLIGFNNLIPISLYVTTDIVRTFQSQLMQADRSMHHAKTESFCRVRNSNLNENLGQIEFVLTDKTGTLTDNHMRFKACSIAGKYYGCWDDNGPTENVVQMPPYRICAPLNDVLQQQAEAQGPIPGLDSPDEPLSCIEPGMRGAPNGDEATSSSCLGSGMGTSSPMTKDEELIDHFFLCLATCHTAIVEQLPSSGRRGSPTSSVSDVTPRRGSSQEGSSSYFNYRRSMRGARTNDTIGSRRSSNSSINDGFDSPMGLCHEEGVPQSASAVSFREPRSRVVSAMSNRNASTMPTMNSLSETDGGHHPSPSLVGMPSNPAREERSSRFRFDPSIGLDSEVRPISVEAQGVVFRSSSPDEEALVAAARDYGYFFRKKVASQLTINVRGINRYYSVLICNEFSSERKRMSVLVQRCDEKSGMQRTMSRAGVSVHAKTHESLPIPLDVMTPSCTLERVPGAAELELEHTDSEKAKYPAILYVKGADNVMFERVKQDDMNGQLKEHMKQFSSQGLRTLICAKRELTPEQTDHFVRRMHEAQNAFMHRETMIEAVANELEQELEVIGVTAIEDKIQHGVPETVSMLLRGGIKVWMLTGDNMETAINIGLACRLIHPEMQQYKLDACLDLSPQNIHNELDRFYRDISRRLQDRAFKYCLVLHGKVLYTIMEEDQANLRQLFLAIACSSCSVIACRLAPAQKAALVKLVRNSVVGNPLTLAIGDGGNDVSMIQEAHVGVGILGMEGRQAANAADFTIGQFRFLSQMLFVHGRWNLRRISTVICYTFYKNALLVLPLVFYMPSGAFSGTTLYDSWLLSCFNLFFTGLPVIIAGVFDVDVSAEMAMVVPSLYQLGIRRSYFNHRVLIGWIVRGLLHAALVYMGMFFVMSTWRTPPLPDYHSMGTWAYGTNVVVANVMMMLHTSSWMDWQVLVILGSALIFLPMISIYSNENFFVARLLESQSFVGVSSCLFTNLRTWMGLFFVTTSCVMSELVVSFVRKTFNPAATDILQEVEHGHFSCGEPAAAAQYADAWTSEVDGGPGCIKNPRAEVKLRSLASPPPRVHHLKPEGRVGLKPLVRPNSFPRPQHRSFSGAHAVVPVPDPDITPLIEYPATWYERVLLELYEWSVHLWKKQWVQMTVVQLTDGLNYDHIEVSKHFKNAIHSSIKPDGNDFEAAASRGIPATPPTHVPQTPRDDSASNVGGEPLDSPQAQAGRRASLVSAISQHSHMSHASAASTESNEVVQDLVYSLLSLRFLSPAKEDAFLRKFLAKQAVQIFRGWVFFIGALVLMRLAYDIIADSQANPLYISVCILSMPIFAMLLYFVRTSLFESHAEFFITSLVITVTVLTHAYFESRGQNALLFSGYYPVMIVSGVRIRFPLICFILLFHLVIIALRYSLGRVVLTTTRTGVEVEFEHLVLMLFISCLSMYYSYQLEKQMRKDFFVLDSIDRSKLQALEILKGMFPEEVVNHVLSKVRGGVDKHSPDGLKMKKLQEDRGIVSIIFCDIAEFASLVEGLKPVELVQLLDLVWMRFDRICERNGVVKIETVGKTYMAAAMPDDAAGASADRHKQDATNAILTAIGMLELVGKRFTGIGAITKVSVGIGVHTGRALSGVVGSQKPQFALFGDTVNTASRMQSTGKKNRLHISSNTYQYLRSDPRFEWDWRKTFVKGKGNMDTYILKKYELKNKDGLQKRTMAARYTHQPAPVATMSSLALPKPDSSKSLPNNDRRLVAPSTIPPRLHSSPCATVSSDIWASSPSGAVMSTVSELTRREEGDQVTFKKSIETVESQEEAKRAELVEKEKAAEPAEKETAAGPAEKEQAAEPSEKEKAAEPAEKEKAAEPAEEEKAAEPAEKEKAAEPTDEEKAAEPAEKENAAEPAEKEKAAEPAEKEKGPEPAEKEKGPEPAEKEKAAEPAEKEKAPEPAEKEKAAEPAEREEAAEPAQKEKAEEMPEPVSPQSLQSEPAQAETAEQPVKPKLPEPSEFPAQPPPETPPTLPMAKRQPRQRDTAPSPPPASTKNLTPVAPSQSLLQILPASSSFVARDGSMPLNNSTSNSPSCFQIRGASSMNSMGPQFTENEDDENEHTLDGSVSVMEGFEMRAATLTLFQHQNSLSSMSFTTRLSRQASSLFKICFVPGTSSRSFSQLSFKQWLKGLCRKQPKDATPTRGLRSGGMLAQWVSFQAFIMCFVLESVFVLESRSNLHLREGRHHGSAFEIGLRLAFIGVTFVMSLALLQVGRRTKWGTKASPTVAVAFSNTMALIIFAGFICSFFANVQHAGNADSFQWTFWAAYEGFFFVMILVHICRMNPQSMLPIALCFIAFIVILSYVGMKSEQSTNNSNSEKMLILDSVGFSILLMGTSFISHIFDPRRRMSNHKDICEEHERVSALLDSMLPREILMEMKSGQLSLAYNYEDMTFLFADIVGFTVYCAEHTAEQAVNLVTRLFAQFDEQAVKLGIYKVCTIGDAYVVVNEPRTQQSTSDKRTDCGGVFNMAKYMLATIIKVRTEVNHHGLDMRIGLHHGSFVGGVIGTKRLRFDIWGEDVLVGNSVESHGKAGEICVSEPAKHVLAKYDPQLQFTFNQDMNLKSGRVVPTYVCKPPDGSSFVADLYANANHQNSTGSPGGSSPQAMSNLNSNVGRDVRPSSSSIGGAVIVPSSDPAPGSSSPNNHPGETTSHQAPMLLS